MLPLVSSREGLGGRILHAAGEIADRLVASGLLTSIEPPIRSRSTDGQEPACRSQAVMPDWLINELVALAYADRMLNDALGKTQTQSAARAPMVDWPLSLSDVITASISARLNGAYVYPEHGYAHELLALAALLGHLVQGRTAYLPPSIAGTLLDVLSAKPSADDQTVAVLRTYIEWAVGANRLMLWARIITPPEFPVASRRGRDGCLVQCELRGMLVCYSVLTLKRCGTPERI